jgi:hypothetical protein
MTNSVKLVLWLVALVIALALLWRAIETSMVNG